MNLPQAIKYAEFFAQALLPYCDKLQVAGSIRRGRPNCNDIDLVVIPKFEHTLDMFGSVVNSRNLVWDYAADWVALGKATWHSGGNQPGKFAILQFPKCQLDVYFATPTTWGTRLMQRTGSKAHNIWVAERAIILGMNWEPYEGLRRDGKILAAETEEEIYQNLGCPFIEPKNREIDWIGKNIDSTQRRGDAEGERI